MSELDKESLKRVAELARIECGEDELNTLYEKIKKILDYMELLSMVDTENVPLCSHVHEAFPLFLRDDVAEESLDKATFLSNAPAQIGGMIKVPPVIKDKHA